MWLLGSPPKATKKALLITGLAIESTMAGGSGSGDSSSVSSRWAAARI
jgi:hypothetical protein